VLKSLSQCLLSIVGVIYATLGDNATGALEEWEIEVFEQASQPAVLENNACCELKDTSTLWQRFGGKGVGVAA